MPNQLPAAVDLMPPIQGGTSFNVTIRMSGVVTQPTSVQLGCSNTSVVTPSGSGSFPLTLTVPTGQSSITVPLQSNTVTAPTPVQLYVGDANTDLGSCANWRAAGTVLILGSGSAAGTGLITPGQQAGRPTF